jgi:ribonuclease P protein component
MPNMLAGATFPRAARLLESEDFVRALKTRAQRGRYLWVYRRSAQSTALDTADAPLATGARPQLGLMIGKKNARTSVLRNAIKRRIREQFRLRQCALPTSQYVVRLSVTVSTKDIAAIIAEWTGALERDIAKLAAAAQSQSASPSVNV